MLCSGLGEAAVVSAITVSLCRNKQRKHVEIKGAAVACNEEETIWRVTCVDGLVAMIRPNSATTVSPVWIQSNLNKKKKTQPEENVFPPREKLKLFQTKCWSSGEDDECSQGDISRDECLALMDPELLLSEELECKQAFVATLGTVLHHPCSCSGVQNDHVQTCNWIHDVLHNRSLFSECPTRFCKYNLFSECEAESGPVQVQRVSFIFQWRLGRAAADLWYPRKSTNLARICHGPTVNSQVLSLLVFLLLVLLLKSSMAVKCSKHFDELKVGFHFSDYLLYAFATVLLVGVVVLMPLALACKIWWGNWTDVGGMRKRRFDTRR